MKYITKRTSETGKKFEKIEKRINDAFEKIKELGSDLGFEIYSHGPFQIAGIVAVQFDNQPNSTIYKKVKGDRNFYAPNLRSTAGRDILEKFKECGVVTSKELNDCIGLCSPWKTIGYDFSNEQYFGFEVGESWKVDVPEDCTEVTVKDFNNLFYPES